MGDEAVDRAVLMHPVCVLATGRDSAHPATLLIANNPYGAPEQAAIIRRTQVPLHSLAVTRVPNALSDLRRFDDLLTGRPGAVGAMLSADSVWLVRFIPQEDRSELIPLCEMPPRKPTDERIRALILAVEDYDYDGRTEAFVYVYSSRPQDRRALFCVEIETRYVQWMLPVATPVVWGDVICAPDSLNPAAIIVTSRQILGNTDAVFDDRISQMALVDSAGGIVWLRSLRQSFAVVVPAEERNQFYVIHSTFDSLPQTDSSVTPQRMISKMDMHGRLIRSTPTTSMGVDMWKRPYGPNRIPALWVPMGAGVIQVYDTSLTLLAQTDSCDLGKYLACTAMAPFDDSVLVFTSGIYTMDFKQLAAPPMDITDYQPVMFDSTGRVTELVMTRPNGYFLGYCRPRGFVEMLTILYVEYQTSVLMAVTALVVALVLVNFFRYRNKSTARLITRQKQELEQTHQALKEAQATIVAQEKYRQARDIAGGFAHEIRNALFPAEAALHKLLNRRSQSADEAETVRRYLNTAVSSVTRAIGVTELISNYTRLESEAAEEAIDLAAVIHEVIEANHLRIQEQGVAVESPREGGLFVRSNQKQLFMVVNNLVVNSMDALTNRPSPRIILSVGRDADLLLLSVTDNGTGIAPEALPRVFDTFFSTKPNTGNGLGLAIAKRIVELYGGTIAVASEPGAWTRFDLRLRATSPHAGYN
jgi:signal transduction histidine kinase